MCARGDAGRPGLGELPLSARDLPAEQTHCEAGAENIQSMENLAAALRDDSPQICGSPIAVQSGRYIIALVYAGCPGWV
jgi:hypothetical protein